MSTFTSLTEFYFLLSTLHCFFPISWHVRHKKPPKPIFFLMFCVYHLTICPEIQVCSLPLFLFCPMQMMTTHMPSSRTTQDPLSTVHKLNTEHWILSTLKGTDSHCPHNTYEKTESESWLPASIWQRQHWPKQPVSRASSLTHHHGASQPSARDGCWAKSSTINHIITTVLSAEKKDKHLHLPRIAQLVRECFFEEVPFIGALLGCFAWNQQGECGRGSKCPS